MWKTSETPVDVNRPVTTVMVTATAAFIYASLLVAPGMVGGMVSLLGFSPLEAGLVISAELGAMAIASILATLWLHLVNWHTAFRVTIMLSIIGNAASFTFTSHLDLVLARFLTGVVAGISAAIVVATIGMTRDPDRTFGYWFGGQLLFGALGLALLPHIFRAGGYGMVYLIIASLLIGLLFGVRYLPAHSPARQEKREHRSPIFFYALVGLSAAFIYQTGEVGVWVYFERIGNAAGLSIHTVAYSLSIATIFGLAGSLTAAAVTTRWGRALPLTCGATLSLVGMSLLMMQLNGLLFLGIASVFSFGWYFTLPYILASIANADPSGRMVVWGNSTLGFGVAAGPVFAGTLQRGESFAPVIWAGMFCVIIGFMFILKLALYRGAQGDN